MNSIKHLLPQVSRYFKTNLHTHSTISDGSIPPAQVKERYKALGYHILCLTDHNVIVDHSNLCDPDFLMLTGTEVNYNNGNYRSGFDGQTYHINLIAKRPDNLWFPGATRRFAEPKTYEDMMQCEGMDIRYSTDSINAMIAKANEMGFLVMYNHPTWSCQSYPDYAPLKGLWGMEVRNSECCQLGNNENNIRVFKDLLNLGNRVYPIGTDDMHSSAALGLSWIMVGAEELTYDSVIEALEKGDFYMSCGPEISSLSIEGNILKLTCSNAKHITLESHGRFARCRTATDENWIQAAEFDLTDFLKKADSDPTTYIYLTVTAPDGTYAVTRAYYTNELQ